MQFRMQDRQWTAQAKRSAQRRTLLTTQYRTADGWPCFSHWAFYKPLKWHPATWQRGGWPT